MADRSHKPMLHLGRPAHGSRSRRLDIQWVCGLIIECQSGYRLAVSIQYGGLEVLCHALRDRPLVAPFKVTEIDFGGQVVKYPADDPEPAIEAVMAVVPG